MSVTGDDVVVTVENRDVVLRANGIEIWRTRSDDAAKFILAALSPLRDYVAVTERFYSLKSISRDRRATVFYNDTIAVLCAKTGRVVSRALDCDIVKSLDWQAGEDGQRPTLVASQLEPIFEGQDNYLNRFHLSKDGWLLPVMQTHKCKRSDIPARILPFTLVPGPVFDFIEKQVVDQVLLF